MKELLLILSLFLVLWIWRDNLGAREKALSVSRRACEQLGAQLLDDTVSLVKVRLCRTNAGTMALCRFYDFDFSLDGEHRRSGSISMKAQRIEDIVLDIDQAKNLQ